MAPIRPTQIARLHRIIVLRDLGLPLKSIKKLVGSHSRLQDILRLQRETLESQQDKIRRAIALIDVALCQIDGGRDPSLDELPPSRWRTAAIRSILTSYKTSFLRGARSMD
jgi:DNA-binding transcriptional MerR regulator